MLRGRTKQSDVQEIIRLRREEKLNAFEIVARTGLSEWRVRQALRKAGISFDRFIREGRNASWNGEEMAILQRLYPTAEWDEIAAALPRRKVEAIMKKANALGMRRHMPQTRRSQRPILPLCKQLRQIREMAGKTRPEVSAESGYHINQLLGWETGKTVPTLAAFVAWANSLDMDLVLKPRVEILQSADRARLMAGR